MPEDFLKRWSRRKIEARKPAPADAVAAPAASAAAAPLAAAAPSPTAQPAAPAPVELPPVESLTADSDFSPFMRAEVDATLRREALKKLLHDPRFNVMDGLDVYIDDYTKPDPLPEGWLEKLAQYRSLTPEPEEKAEEAPQEGAPGEAPVAEEAPPQAPEEPAGTSVPEDNA